MTYYDAQWVSSVTERYEFGDISGCLEICETAVKADSDEPLPHVLTGFFYLLVGEPYLAEKRFIRGIIQGHDFAAAHYGLALTGFILNDQDIGWRHIYNICRFKSSTADAGSFTKFIEMIRCDELEPAIKHLLPKEGIGGDAHAILVGLAHLIAGDRGEARDCFLGRGGEGREAAVGRFLGGILLINDGGVEDGIEKGLEQLEAIGKGGFVLWDVHFILANIYLDKEQWHRSITHFKKYAQRDFSPPPGRSLIVFQSLARAYREANDPVHALEALENALIHGGDPEFIEPQIATVKEEVAAYESEREKTRLREERTRQRKLDASRLMKIIVPAAAVLALIIAFVFAWPVIKSMGTKCTSYFAKSSASKEKPGRTKPGGQGTIEAPGALITPSAAGTAEAPPAKKKDKKPARKKRREKPTQKPSQDNATPQVTENADLQTTLPAYDPDFFIWGGAVIKKFAAVRAKPTTNSRMITKLKFNGRVKVLKGFDKGEKWYYVETPSGKTGYMWNKTLKVEKIMGDRAETWLIY